jgi:hypothetical protein
MLSLAEIEKGHHGRLLVLRGIAIENHFDERQILGGELEWYGRIVIFGIAMLRRKEPASA